MPNVYNQLIERIFLRAYTAGAAEVAFVRTDIDTVANELGLARPKNLGDLLYTYRFRASLPAAITDTAPEGKQWVIAGAGRGRYAFRLSSQSRVVPNPSLLAIKIPDATPQIIAMHAFGDEQALLAKVRYNRLIDTFLSLTTYSLQNHLRTTVPGVGQIEIDELYVGVSSRGSQFIIPVQAKGGTDEIGVVQTQQDLAFCAARFPLLKPRAVAAQFMENEVIALFELVVDDSDIKVVEERHYRLVPGDDIAQEDLDLYGE